MSTLLLECTGMYALRCTHRWSIDDWLSINWRLTKWGHHVIALAPTWADLIHLNGSYMKNVLGLVAAWWTTFVLLQYVVVKNFYYKIDCQSDATYIFYLARFASSAELTSQNIGCVLINSYTAERCCI